ncbi:hypothetical protein ACFLXT_01425 [Chloroflexota bacterium]
MKQGRRIGKSKKEIRVLYVCPWAHRGGHYPQAVVREATAFTCQFSASNFLVSICV